MCISGSVIGSDWQAIKEDPCNQFSELEFDISNECRQLNNELYFPVGTLGVIILSPDATLNCAGTIELGFSGNCSQCMCLP